ncbi:16S rRNA (cytidine(1402)-2'-O)-methyltransferase [Pacificimonas flava]|uniref:Ribosomal RNA small subunit methyltransferase I n=2 Tax=Pacificimonas TaxID=1960290 RepID=A0A219B3M5_9SPHN|nr:MULTISPECIES: 16S rRNA (cytidine(1402)-2'-O)-methyltransferase [Pacificimonas]MBZ6377523.1 16S rRNA (cytidine(1402)-2'-O)-methyltransferase [Pacificimonas aurantium]OWV32784.1 16S rRNA (cytidine(1402)-2'-O)-methyltransferase [Pacificimonas flava]
MDTSQEHNADPSAEAAAGLYIVATPIGNLNDLTLRAAETLRAAVLIGAEDTRVTGKLLKHIGARAPMIRHDEHSAERARPELIERAKTEAVAIVSDAGTPLISDPGYRLVREARAAGVRVVPVPGVSAVTAALSGAGLPTDRFLFAGFPPPKEKALKDKLGELGRVKATLVFYETGPRLGRFLSAAADILGEREACVARELTKLHEEFLFQPLPGLAAHYAERGPPKGEIVVLIGPPESEGGATGEDLDEALRAALESASLKDAVKAVTAQLGLPRSQVYARALELKTE